MARPKPKKNEGQEDFVKRCVDNPTMDADFPDDEERLSECTLIYENSKKSEDYEEDSHKVFIDTVKTFDERLGEINKDERSIVTRISTSVIDRSGDIVRPDGMDQKYYRKNPVVLFGHDSYSLPIGRNMWVKQVGKEILAKTQYVSEAINPLAEKIWQYRLAGFPMAQSIGFKTLKAVFRSWFSQDSNPELDKELAKLVELGWLGEKEKDKVTRVIQKFDLLEYSDVVVPANPEAVVKAYDLGIINDKQADKLMIRIKNNPIPLVGEKPSESIIIRPNVTKGEEEKEKDLGIDSGQPVVVEPEPKQVAGNEPKTLLTDELKDFVVTEMAKKMVEVMSEAITGITFIKELALNLVKTQEEFNIRLQTIEEDSNKALIELMTDADKVTKKDLDGVNDTIKNFSVAMSKAVVSGINDHINTLLKGDREELIVSMWKMVRDVIFIKRGVVSRSGD